MQLSCPRDFASPLLADTYHNRNNSSLAIIRYKVSGQQQSPPSTKVFPDTDYNNPLLPVITCCCATAHS